MFVLIVLLSYLSQGTLTTTIPPISNLFSGGLETLYASDPVIVSRAGLITTTTSCTCPADQRSIWDIVWSCLATLFACSWVSVHPDIPAHGEKWWRSSLRRMEYMFWTLMTPEMIICWAARQWAGARRIQREQKSRGWTVTHGNFMQMGGFMLFNGNERKGTLSYDRFVALLDKGRINFPEITQEEIEDRSKSDGLSKTLVIAQTGWFVLQCIARTVRRLPISELELATLAFAALNGFMYFFWWDKPFDVRCPYPVHLISTGPEDITMPTPTFYDESNSSRVPLLNRLRNPLLDIDQIRISTIIKWPGWTSLLTWPWTFLLFVGHRLRAMNEDEDQIRAFDDRTRPENRTGPMRVPTFYSLVAIDDDLLYLTVPAIGSLFGAIHCAGWDFHFPTLAELWIWRISSVVIAALPFVLLAIVYLSLMFSIEEKSDMAYFCVTLLLFLGLTTYVVARLIILVESFMTLRDLPPEAYDVVQWTSFLPHI